MNLIIINLSLTKLSSIAKPHKIRLMKPLLEKVLCAFCRLERKVYVKKHVDWTNVVWAFVVSLLLMVVIWGQFEPKFLVLFAIVLSLAEVFVHLRWRLSLPCVHCGFDPLLYKTKRDLAVARVKAKLEEARQKGSHLLRQNNPFENIPVIQKREDGRVELLAPKSKGNMLSKQV